MTLIHILVVNLALGACAYLSSPLSHRHPASDGGFSLTVYRSQSLRMMSPAQIMVKTAAKYGTELPGNLKTSVDAGKGSVLADPVLYDKEYLSKVRVGNQVLRLDIDTGSSDLWVFSTLMSKTQQGNHSVYNPNMSSTAKPIPSSSWMILYGDGSSAGGTVVTDCVAVGDTVVENQGVEIASEASGSLLSDVTDGIIGLGFDSLNDANPPQKTFMRNAIDQGLPKPVFTADLYPRISGTYDFGFINHSSYSGNITYAPVDNSDGYWKINMTGWSFGSGNNKTSSSPSFSQASIVDTGTTILFLSANIVRGYWATVNGSTYSRIDSGYIYPCDTLLPDFTVQVGRFSGIIPGDLLKYAPASSPSMCFGAIQNNPTLPYNILGDVFLKTIFVIFDQGQSPRIGFAQKALRRFASMSIPSRGSSLIFAEGTKENFPDSPVSSKTSGSCEI